MAATVLSDMWNTSTTPTTLTPTLTPTTPTDSSADAEDSVFSHPVYKASTYIWYFASPVILVLGNFGNIMTILIMRRNQSGEAVINIYFTALAVIDLVTLDMFLLFEWVGTAFGYYVHYQSDVVCRIHSWTIGATTMGGWFLVGLTSHRAVSVVWPHRVGLLCTRRLVTTLIVTTTIFFSGVYSQYLYGYHLAYSADTDTYQCAMRTGSYAAFVANVFSFIDLAFYSVLPFACIFLANIVLIWKLRKTLQEIRHKFAEQENVVAREKAASSVTLTIILVSVAYVALTLPVSVYYISFFVYDPLAVITVDDLALTYLVRAVTFMLMFCNSAINFYLYCLTGGKFRKEFVLIISCRKTLRCS
ncbi:hypothetical protein ACOMHN_044334 [Nucella lapillus]